MLGAAALAVILLIALFTGVIPGLRLKPSAPARLTLTVWGVFDSEQVFTDLANIYRKDRANVEINYRKFEDPNTYESELINALAAGTGPDIFMFQNTWLPKHRDKIVPVSTTTLPYATFRDAFPQVVSEQFAPNQIIYASPLYLDTLALFYNKDIFDKNSIPLPPTTWTEFKADANKLKQLNSSTNEIFKAGAAIGGSNQSINRGTDILNLLMLQSGTQMVDSNFVNATFAQTSPINGIQAGLNSLNFYTAFANPSSPDYTWNENLHYSVDNFAEGNVAMMFNYSHQIPILHAKNPFLNLGIAPAPLEEGCGNTMPPSCVSYANYWGLSVSKKSRNQAWAWDFVINTTMSEAAAQGYFTATKKPPALKTLINRNLNEPVYGVFIRQALIARSWPQIDNNVVDRSFSDMIQAVITGRSSPVEALSKAQDEITHLMQNR